MKTLLKLLFFGLMIIMTTSSKSITTRQKINPILPGFYPDPSICRVGDDYYLINSSFEWFPGIPIHHSKDLVHWDLIGYGLNRPSQVTFKTGLKDHFGVFAPTIRYHNGTFYIINTLVGAGGNFYITATNPAGPWSAPHWIKDAIGIDPSLFWDADGRAYYVGQGNIEPNAKVHWGVWLQEIDLKEGKLIGKRKQLTLGSRPESKWTEGPHLYKIDGKYVLLVAEDGTEFEHSVVIFNSDKLWGPYKPIKENPVMTHRNLPKDYPIRATGHADLVQTQNGDWWSVLLAKRYYNGYMPLSRETFLAKINMINKDGEVYPEYNDGCGKILFKMEVPKLRDAYPAVKLKSKSSVWRDDFTSKKLNLEWNFLRTPVTKWWKTGGGELEIAIRKEKLTDLANPSFIARRINSFKFEASTSLVLDMNNQMNAAGMAIYRDSKHSVQLMLSENYVKLVENNGKMVDNVLERVRFRGNRVLFNIKCDGDNFTFYYGTSEDNMKEIGGKVSMGLISDSDTVKYNGSYVGMYAVGMGDVKANAHFQWFSLKNRK